MGRARAREARLSVLAQTVALALDVEGDRAVEQAIEDGGGHHLVGEDLSLQAPQFCWR